jgi:hypothetical protein
VHGVVLSQCRERRHECEVGHGPRWLERYREHAPRHVGQPGSQHQCIIEKHHHLRKGKIECHKHVTRGARGELKLILSLCVQPQRLGDMAPTQIALDDHTGAGVVQSDRVRAVIVSRRIAHSYLDTGSHSDAMPVTPQVETIADPCGRQRLPRADHRAVHHQLRGVGECFARICCHLTRHDPHSRTLCHFLTFCFF